MIMPLSQRCSKMGNTSLCDSCKYLAEGYCKKGHNGEKFNLKCKDHAEDKKSDCIEQFAILASIEGNRPNMEILYTGSFEDCQKITSLLKKLKSGYIEDLYQQPDFEEISNILHKLICENGIEIFQQPSCDNDYLPEIYHTRIIKIIQKNEFNTAVA
jgi:hypothetical protein